MSESANIFPRNVLLIAAILAGLILFGIGPGLFHGIDRFYLEYPDADVMFPYWALLLNGDLAQDWYDHPAAFYIIFLGYWYGVLKFLGIIEVAELADLPGPAAFEPHFADLVISGRVFGLILAAVFIAVFFIGLFSATGKLRLSAIFTMLFSASPGFAIHLIQLRSELLSAAFLCAVFFLLLAAVKNPEGSYSGLKLALASLLAVLALETKVIAIVPLLAAVAVTPIFAARISAAGSAGLAWSNLARSDLARSNLAGQKSLLFICGAIFAVPMASELYFQWDGFRLYFLAPLLVPPAAIAIYCFFFRRRLDAFFEALAWMSIGLGGGYLLNFLDYDPNNIRAVVYFLDHVAKFTVAIDEQDTAMVPLALRLLTNLLSILKNTFLGLFTGEFGFGLAYWSVLAMAIMTLAEKDYRTTAQLILLLGIALGTIVIFSLRGSVFYGVYYHFWIVIALAWGADWALGRKAHKKLAVQSAAGAIIVFAIALQSNNFMHRAPVQGISNVCAQSYAYLHRIRHHFDHYCPDFSGSRLGR